MSIWRRDSTNRLVKIKSFDTSPHSLRAIEFLSTMENIEDDNVIQREKTLREYFSPITTNHLSCIVLPQTSATHFELKPEVIQLLPSFYGLDREDPYMHVKEFLDICSTFRFQNFSDESIRLRLFPFSLKDKAKAWLNSLIPNSVTSWDLLRNKFLTKIFPMSKTNALRREISDFYQNEGEQFYECWERFKDLLLKCPHHGFERWRLVQYFYNGLNMSSRYMIESMNGGAFLNLSENNAWKVLETLSENSQQWDFSNQRERPVQAPKRGGLYEVRDDVDIKIALSNLTRKVEALALGQTSNSSNAKNEICGICVNPSHAPQPCSSLPNQQDFFAEQVNALNFHGKSPNSPYSSTYNPNWRNHPNFSWRQNLPPMNQENQQFVPPNPTYPQQPQRKSSLEDTLQQFMQSTQQVLQSNSQAISKLETQLGQLATAVEKKKFPSQPIPNPKGQFEIGSSSISDKEEAKSITTLRSGKTFDNNVKMPENREEIEKSQQKYCQNEVMDSEHTAISRKDKSHESNEIDQQPVSYVPRAPYPQRLAPIKKGTQYNDILEMFKQVSINIPLLNAIKQVPSYAKFLKDLCTVKRRTNIPQMAFLTEHLSSILQNKIPIKYKDPGSPTISCTIGDNVFDRALLDLGASVNLLPYSIYVELGLGSLKVTLVTLQLADRSVKIPRGIIENVLVKVDKFYFPVDFIVLDTQPVTNLRDQIPVILGRPFLTTANALINCGNGVMKLSFGNMTVELNVFNACQQPHELEDLCDVNMIDGLVDNSFEHCSSDDPLENDNNELVSTRMQNGWRVCINFRKLNSVIMKYQFHLPFIDS